MNRYLLLCLVVAEATKCHTPTAKSGAAAAIISADGKQLAEYNVGRTDPAALSALESFNVGADTHSRFSLKYHTKSPIMFSGSINSIKVKRL